MNKPFSFRSESRESLSSGRGLLDAAPVKIHWHRPTRFDLTPRPVVNRRDEVSQTPVGAPLPPISDSRLPRFSVPCACAFVLALLPLVATAQSLWRDDISKPMYADKRAASAGDILTILVQESTSSTKDNKTETGKKSGLDASLETFLYSPAASGLLTKGGTLPALKFNSKSDFAGGGAINNSEKLSARAAVQVMDVLPNKNLVIEGRRETSVGGEQQTMVLRGIVRPEDVLANNTVYSYNVADASIQIISKGTITDSQRKGWFHKVWDKVSPF